MARDSGSYTTSNLPVTDPLHTLVVSAASANNTNVLSYTTTGAHNLYVGAPVIIYGTGNVGLNFNPDGAAYGGVTSTTALGWGTPAVVNTVTGTNTFTVKAPSVVATASVSTGTVVNDALVSNSGWDQSWLPTTAQTNVVVAREWGNAFPIQNNDDRAAVTALASSAPSGNGTQVTYTVASHSYVPGQVVSIQGVVPDVYNVEYATIAATTSTTIVINSTNTAPVVSYTNGSIVSTLRTNGVFPTISSAIGATGVTGVTKTTTATTTATTSIGVNSTTGLVVGGVVTGTNVASNTVVTAIGSGTITISPATTGAVASAATLTFGSGLVNLYTTAQAHGLTAGQNVSVINASVAPYNVSGVVQATTATTFSVKAPTFKITKVSGTSTSAPGTVGDGSNVVYYTDSAHGFVGGETVNISGFTPSGYNVVNGTVLTTPSLTTSSFAVANTTGTTAVTAYGFGLKNSGSFSGTANISVADNSWNSTYTTPSGNLVPGLDNHDRVTNSDSGYPAFTPTYNTPNIVGLTTTNAIQKLRAAGQTPGFIQFSTDITATTVATTSTTLQVTSGTAHNLSVGDTVNLSGSSNTTLNIGDAIVSVVNSTVSFTVLASGCTGTVGSTALVFRPKNAIVSAQSPSAGATTATVVGFTRNYGI